LAKYVYKIVDHHDDKNFNYAEEFPLLQISEDDQSVDTTRVNTQYPRASAQALVLEEFFKDKFLKEYLQLALKGDEHNYFDFLIGTIVTDSFRFDANVKGSKWVDDDQIVVNEVFSIIRNSAFYSIQKGEDKLFQSKDNNFHLDQIKKNLINIKFDEEANLALGLNGLMNKDRKNKTIKNKVRDIKCSLHSLPVSLNKIIKLENKGTPIQGPLLKDYLKNLGESDELDFSVIISRDTDGSSFAAVFISNDEICNESNIKIFLEKYNKDVCKSEGSVDSINGMFNFVKSKKNISRKLFLPQIEEFYNNL
jgi:hypothetical protein